MKIAFIGMSGSGKSHWSKKLAEKGFYRFCCDDLIEAKLGDELKRLGYTGIADVAKWMGQPFEPQHKENSRKYLYYEKEILQEIISELKQLPKHKKVIVDTTGSLIYLEKQILKELTDLTKIIYLDVPDFVKEDMYHMYMRDPKPVVWGNSFIKKPDESNRSALQRCYPELLTFRSDKYVELADKTISYHLLRQRTFTVENFLELLAL